MNEYAVLYWAAACLAFWAGSGVTKGQFAQAVDMICHDAQLTIPQEVVLKRLLNDMTMENTENGID